MTSGTIFHRPIACLLLLFAASGIARSDGRTNSVPAKVNKASDETPLPAGLHYYVPPRLKSQHTVVTDVCVYGGTAAGVVAAVQAVDKGHHVVLIEQGAHLGGMTSGGLSYTDIGNKDAIGGMALEFYRACGRAYNEPIEWKFEPHVAERILDQWVAGRHIPVYFREFVQSVNRDASGHINSLTTESGLTVQARIFIDAGYEGDLMARARVKYRVGREDNRQYKETYNGVQVRGLHQFTHHIDPYMIEKDPHSGLVPGIDPSPLPPMGSGDSRVQAYNFRLCLTGVPNNRMPFAKPRGYDPDRYILLGRLMEAGFTKVYDKFDAIQGKKYDKNNDGPVSTDFIGENWEFPEADYKTRERIFQAHAIYQMGLMWYLCNDPHVPAKVREDMREYGLCKDEFRETGGWPHQLYIREARRMVSDYVMTEHNCRGTALADDAVGLAAYTMDSHNCRRFVEDGYVKNEGDVQVGGTPPYPISYRSIVPARGQCDNLIVPVCLSASHIAYGSIRMEPVFMILGQSAALAADIALRDSIAVQDVPYSKLKPALLAAHQTLAWVPRASPGQKPAGK